MHPELVKIVDDILCAGFGTIVLLLIAVPFSLLFRGGRNVGKNRNASGK